MTLTSSSEKPLRILTIGASYGLLPAAKVAAAGHAVTVLGRAEEVSAMRQEGVEIAFSDQHVLRSPMGDDGLSLATPDGVDPSDFDLVLLAVQEPQVRSPEISNLLQRIGDKVPVASIMNMPPPPFLDRIRFLPKNIGKDAYEHPSIWEPLPAERMTLASPDPQAFRPDAERPGHLQVTLASNFKFAPFAREEDQAILARVTRDATRAMQSWGRPPVHLLARGSVFAPLSKWPMLVTGNCRCLRDDGGPVSIREAVNENLSESRLLYEAVNTCLEALGAPNSSLVPFNSYLQAAGQLSRPSSLARGLAAGATAVERIDVIVLNLMREAKSSPAAINIMTGINARITAALAENHVKSRVS
ncbi:hypothetical protein C1J03_12325 [Sulfitobacter sp. SK012]|uniref:2-dehydropantoate 2-reductase N-terminal domain-containing protein n=1 Tax=Sulfitobacter sp. SK012 TaxID=1389005 RepID=UPI000E0A9A65|nr:2-dehydropantoate 2-reductase N-terminal domain-containing protein [Sulfitobacter sp. SK012]AXI46737.1 hypothetical protein C1J03_12325 [Sulfitobacter sp. SK012]